MIRFLLRRLIGWVLMILVVTNLTYFLAWAYLDPRSNYVGRRPPLDEQQIEGLLRPRNLDNHISIWHRWWEWISGIFLHWDWGVSPQGGSVTGEIGYRMWVSGELVLGATIIATLLGIALGVYTAARQYKASDRVAQGTSIITMNVPIIVAAQAIVLLAIALNDDLGRRIFYVTGASNPEVHGFLADTVDRLQHLVLPTVALIFISYANYHFLQRTLLLDNINADYVRTARAKGLTKAQAVRRHALRTSLIPVITQVAFSIPAAFTGAILTEKIFAWNGMGQYFAQTIANNDIHGVVATAAFGAVLTAVGAVLADIAVVALDPRVRVS